MNRSEPSEIQMREPAVGHSVVHLSVVVPTLARLATARLLARRIRELLPDLETEVIIVSPELPEDEGDSTSVIYVRDTGRGVYAAYRTGIDRARGTYVWLLGDDDYPLDHVAAITGRLKEASADVIVAPVVFSSGRIYRPRRTKFFLLLRNWCQQGVIYRRSVLARHRFYRRLKIQADHYVNVLIRADAALTKEYLDQPICVFGVCGISSRVSDEHFWRLRPRLARRTLSWIGYLMFVSCVQSASHAKRFLRSKM